MQLTSLRTCQVNQQHNLEHCPLHALPIMCIYKHITLSQECDVFELQWNVHRICVIPLELSMVTFRDAYGPKT